MRATHAHARVMRVRRGDGGPRVRQRQVRARSFIRSMRRSDSAHNAGAEHCRLCRIPHTRGRTHEAMSACRRVGGPGPASSHWRSGALEMAAGDASASREPRSDRHPRRTGPTGAAGARHGEFILSSFGQAKLGCVDLADAAPPALRRIALERNAASGHAGARPARGRRPRLVCWDKGRPAPTACWSFVNSADGRIVDRRHAMHSFRCRVISRAADGRESRRALNFSLRYDFIA